MPRTFKAKLADCALDMKTIKGEKATYLFLKAGKSYHVFVEVESKEAAEDCGAERRAGRSARQMCGEIWNRTL